MRRNDDFILREIAGEFVIIPTGMGAAQFSGMITLSATSAAVWQALEQDCSLPQLVEAVTSQFDVSPEQAEADIEALLRQFEALNLLET